MLRDDGARGDDDSFPAELGLEVLDDLVGVLAEGGDGAVGDADEEHLALGAVGLLVFNQLSTVDEDLRQLVLYRRVVYL